VSKTALEVPDIHQRESLDVEPDQLAPPEQKLAGEIRSAQHAFSQLITTSAAALENLPAQQLAVTIDALEQFSKSITEAADMLKAKNRPARSAFQHDHSAFGILKGKLELDGTSCIDGLDYQNRIRAEW
jgi:hypothetical protein